MLAGLTRVSFSGIGPGYIWIWKGGMRCSAIFNDLRVPAPSEPDESASVQQFVLEEVLSPSLLS